MLMKVRRRGEALFPCGSDAMTLFIWETSAACSAAVIRPRRAPSRIAAPRPLPPARCPDRARTRWVAGRLPRGIPGRLGGEPRAGAGGRAVARVGRGEALALSEPERLRERPAGRAHARQGDALTRERRLHRGRRMQLA